nr:immunoglobulin light chain junction region [Macaca mulatta]
DYYCSAWSSYLSVGLF